MKGYTVKIKRKEPEPMKIVKTIFRTHNPATMTHEMLYNMMNKVFKTVANQAIFNTFLSMDGPQSARNLNK